jgi:HSP20 family protein
MKMSNANQFGPRTFNALFEDLLQGNTARFFKDCANHEDWMQHNAQIPVNIKEDDKNYAISLVAPGLKKELFHLQVNDKVLTVSFEQKENTEEKESGKWLRREYKNRSFKRNFNLGDTIDADKIAASYEDGILNITLPKKEAVIATNKTIAVA